jgi:hypothetical protein
MGASTIRMSLMSLLKRLFTAFTDKSPTEIHVNPACVAAWLAESREMRRRASQWAELPPLPSD